MKHLHPKRRSSHLWIIEMKARAEPSCLLSGTPCYHRSSVKLAQRIKSSLASVSQQPYLALSQALDVFIVLRIKRLFPKIGQECTSIPLVRHEKDSHRAEPSLCMREAGIRSHAPHGPPEHHSEQLPNSRAWSNPRTQPGVCLQIKGSAPNSFFR